MAAAAEGDRRLRLEGGGNLLAAARRCGARRYVQQSSGFFLRPGPGLGDESEGLAVEASPRVAASARTYAELEARLTAAGDIEGVALRYGFFYGPGTWYHPDGASADQVRRGEVPVIGDGGGVWSWVHIDDAALATADALDRPARRVPRRGRRPVPGVGLAAGVRAGGRGPAPAAGHRPSRPWRPRARTRSTTGRGCGGRRTRGRSGCSGSPPSAGVADGREAWAKPHRRFRRQHAECHDGWHPGRRKSSVTSAVQPVW